MTADSTIVVGTFDDRGAAERAIEQLRDAGFHRDQIGFAGQDASGEAVLVEEHGNSAGSGAAGGLVTGAVAGGALAWLGLAAIPAIGPFLAGGAIGSALIGAAAGGVTGGVLGGLLGLGIPRHKAEYHEEQIRAGRTLVTVQTAEPAVAERIFNGAGAIDVDRGGAGDAPDAEMDARRTRSFAVETDAPVAPDPVAVPQHEQREADGYRDAGVAAAPRADELDPVGAAVPFERGWTDERVPQGDPRFDADVPAGVRGEMRADVHGDVPADEAESTETAYRDETTGVAYRDETPRR